MDNNASAAPVSKKMQLPAPLRSYPAPWKGQILLACGKCRRKLRQSRADNQIVKLKKALKKKARKDNDGLRVRVIEVSCLKMCPKGGVTVCTQAQLGRGQCSIMRTATDVEALYVQCKLEARSLPLPTPHGDE